MLNRVWSRSAAQMRLCNRPRPGREAAAVCDVSRSSGALAQDDKSRTIDSISTFWRLWNMASCRCLSPSPSPSPPSPSPSLASLSLSIYLSLSLSPSLASSFAFSWFSISEQLVFGRCWDEECVPLTLQCFVHPSVFQRFMHACKASSKASSVKPDDM